MPDGSLQPAVIPFKSTGHTISKGWMVLMNTHRRGGMVMPSFLWLYRLKTVERVKDGNNFFVFDIQNYMEVGNMTLAEAGAALNEAFAAGDKKVDTSNADESGEKQVPF
jgi:hypothetical protein